MKLKLKRYLKLSIILLVAPLCLLQCEKSTFNDTENILKTVSIEQAKDYFNNSETLQRNAETPYITAYTAYITQADIINSDEMLTVVPATTGDSNSYSRILLLNINGEIESVVYSMFSSNNFTTGNFYGDILITDIDGNYINGFRVENGYFIAKYIYSQQQDNNPNIAYRTSNDDCSGCTFSCDLCTLDEVVVTASKKVELGNLYTSIVPNGEDLIEYVGAGDNTGGGGLNDSANTCQPGYVLNTDGICVLADNECPEGFALSEDGECIENPILGADCRSFEYAQPPGALQKACAVTDFGNNFYYGFVRADGSWEAGYFPTNIPLIYFTMPPFMTNGQAANLTAEAITAAILLTDAYVFENADGLTEQQVRSEFTNNIRNAMLAIGGGMTSTAPFTIPSPAPYTTSFFGAATDCN